jgi:hypothetical protein
MEEMKWSSGGFLGVLATNILGFWLMAVAEICQTYLASYSAKRA